MNFFIEVREEVLTDNSSSIRPFHSNVVSYFAL